MEKSYKCNNCNESFKSPLNEEGMFVCPFCGSPDFEAVLLA